MGCRCCRMIKSYIYDPSVAVDVRKTDSGASSLYYPHQLPATGGSGRLDEHDEHKRGIYNPGFSSLKLEADNNHVNHWLHGAPPPPAFSELHRKSTAADGAGLYIIQPDAPAPPWLPHGNAPSQVPVYPDLHDYDAKRSGGWDGSAPDEVDEGVGGTPEYPCDTGDEGSVLSADIHTSTTSLSSADTRDERRAQKTPDASTVESGIGVTKSEEEEEEQSITDSMVAEALAALEAATAGEEEEEEEEKE